MTPEAEVIEPDAPAAEPEARTASTAVAERPKVPRIPIKAGGALSAIVPRDLAEVAKLSSVVFNSGLAPRTLNSLDKVGVAILYGMEIGLLPMQALNSIVVINGKPTIMGDAAIALIEQSDLLVRRREWFTGEPFADDFTAHCEVRRKGREKQEWFFSVAMAKRAHLWEKRGQNGAETPWITYPERMLMWRARIVMRDVFADVLRGMRIFEEARDDDPTLDAAPPAPSILTRLQPGAEDGFDHERINNVINGDANAIREASGEAPTDHEAADGLADEERDAIEEARKAFAGCKTQKEIDVVRDGYVETFSHFSEVARSILAAIEKERRDGLAAKRSGEQATLV